MSNTQFAIANRLWFQEGRTTKALASYKEALHQAPEDPIVAFQFARALWSVDRFDEARSLIEQAHRGRHGLNPTGQREIKYWRARLKERLPDRSSSELPISLLDRDQLEARLTPVSDWGSVAAAAEVREMYGLATYAIGRWGRVPIDAEEARDLLDVEARRDNQEAALARMRDDQRSTKGNPAPEAPGPPIWSAPERTRSSQSQRRAPSPRPPTVAQPKRKKSPCPLPDLPLTLIVRAKPVDGPVDVSTEIVATLRNPTDVPIIVNRRMLLNTIGQPGEVWLEVQGPKGYRNNVGFRIRAGRAAREFFVSLAPGKAVEQSWSLNDYQSLHIPGEYVVTLTYHNEIMRSPDGRPMTVGRIAGATRFRRFS